MGESEGHRLTWGPSRLEGSKDNGPLTGHAFLSPPKLGRLLKVPVLKFLLHSASYLWFLIFLLGESLVMETQLSTFKGRSQSVWETSLHMIWVTGTYARAHQDPSPWPALAPRLGHTEQADNSRSYTRAGLLWHTAVTPTLRKLR